MIKKVLLFLLLLTNFTSWSQGTYLQHNAYEQRIVTRLELIQQKGSRGDASALLPSDRLYIAQLIDSINKGNHRLSEVDLFNLAHLEADNLPWSSEKSSLSKKPLPLGIYKTKANFYAIDTKELKLYINPAFNFQIGHSSLDTKPLYTNTRAVEVRGQINDRLGFYSFISENQIRAPQHEKDFFLANKTLPGTHLVKKFKEDGYDYFTASGYITFKVLPSIGIQFGQGRNFIGHGKRSLLLSDFAADYLFLKINTQVWRLNYQNIYAKMIDRYGPMTSPLPSKYMASHYLGIDLFKNFNLGFYESAVFHDNQGTGRGFDLYYLNPIIFYRSVEHLLGDADKMMVGLNASWLPLREIKLYGQLMVNEFRINDLKANKGNANNKYGYQLGLKYIDIAGINNVDLELEYNRVRPYAYTHRTIGDEPYPVNSYSHYNQPLAHPMGANFSELLVTLNLQPLKRLNIELNLISTLYGADSANSNWGQNIFLDYSTYEQEFNNHPGQGVRTQLNILEAITTYHIRHNLFLDLEFKYRHLNSEINERDSENLYFGTALRLNLDRRRWEY